MSTLIRPRILRRSEPSRDDDPTGVRALLASLPEPDPMPGYLLERINTSLAAEQAQRTNRLSGSTATPLLASTRGRPARLLLTIAGAAAAVVLVAVVAGNPFTVNQSATTSGSEALASTSRTRPASEGAQSDAAQAPAGGTRAGGAPAAASVPTPSLVQISVSGIRYTRADFVSQARALDQAPPPGQAQPSAAKSSGLGPAGATDGLLRCLSAIGGAGAQVVRADVASYEGQPAVIIVATRDGASLAYAVGRQCSPADTAVLRPATPLP